MIRKGTKLEFGNIFLLRKITNKFYLTNKIVLNNFIKTIKKNSYIKKFSKTKFT